MKPLNSFFRIFPKMKNYNCFSFIGFRKINYLKHINNYVLTGLEN